ncbi:DUF6643 family protein [Streptomyces sp. NPDC046203]|uniref:DUF6643 family protein n=1 Tax=Streptomyces sp. NPDC046203 TaxID=3154602 RepID=UPI0034077405
MTSPRSAYGGGYHTAPSFTETPIYDSLVAERGTPQIAPIRVNSPYDTGGGFPGSGGYQPAPPALPSALPALPAAPSAQPAPPPVPAPVPAPAPGYAGNTGGGYGYPHPAAQPQPQLPQLPQLPSAASMSPAAHLTPAAQLAPAPLPNAPTAYIPQQSAVPRGYPGPQAPQPPRPVAGGYEAMRPAAPRPAPAPAPAPYEDPYQQPHQGRGYDGRNTGQNYGGQGYDGGY